MALPIQRAGPSSPGPSSPDPDEGAEQGTARVLAVGPGRGGRPGLVYGRLRELIVLGHLAPGSPLIETELADRLGVSRTPIREVLRRLHLEGLIADAPGPRVFRYVVAPLTRSDAQSLFYIMAELEGLATHAAAQLAAVRRAALATALSERNAALRALAAAAEPRRDQFFELDRAFHRLVTDAVPNPRLHVLHASVEPQVERYWRVYAAERTDAVANSAVEHDAVIRALAAGDADAAQQAVRANWRNSADRLTPAIDRMGERGRWSTA